MSPSDAQIRRKRCFLSFQWDYNAPRLFGASVLLLHTNRLENTWTSILVERDSFSQDMHRNSLTPSSFAFQESFTWTQFRFLCSYLKLPQWWFDEDVRDLVIRSERVAFCNWVILIATLESATHDLATNFVVSLEATSLTSHGSNPTSWHNTTSFIIKWKNTTTTHNQTTIQMRTRHSTATIHCDALQFNPKDEEKLAEISQRRNLWSWCICRKEMQQRNSMCAFPRSKDNSVQWGQNCSGHLLLRERFWFTEDASKILSNKIRRKSSLLLNLSLDKTMTVSFRRFCQIQRYSARNVPNSRKWWKACKRRTVAWRSSFFVAACHHQPLPSLLSSTWENADRQWPWPLNRREEWATFMHLHWSHHSLTVGQKLLLQKCNRPTLSLSHSNLPHKDTTRGERGYLFLKVSWNRHSNSLLSNHRSWTLLPKSVLVHLFAMNKEPLVRWTISQHHRHGGHAVRLTTGALRCMVMHCHPLPFVPDNTSLRASSLSTYVTQLMMISSLARELAEKTLSKPKKKKPNCPNLQWCDLKAFVESNQHLFEGAHWPHTGLSDALEH